MSKRPNSRSGTPHRLSTRPSILPSPGQHYPISLSQTPIDSSQFLNNFQELSDSLVDLDSNIQTLQTIHESLNGFNESFSSFLYALQINAYITEFNQVPDSFKNFDKMMNMTSKIEKLEDLLNERETGQDDDRIEMDETYMTNDEDGSFVIQPRESILLKPNPQQAQGSRTGSTTRAKERNIQGKNSKIPVGRRPRVGGTVTSTGGTSTSGSGGTRGTRGTSASTSSKVDGGVKKKRPPFR